VGFGTCYGGERGFPHKGPKKKLGEKKLKVKGKGKKSKGNGPYYKSSA